MSLEYLEVNLKVGGIWMGWFICNARARGATPFYLLYPCTTLRLQFEAQAIYKSRKHSEKDRLSILWRSEFRSSSSFGAIWSHVQVVAKVVS